MNQNIIDEYNISDNKSDKEYLHKYISNFYDLKIAHRKLDKINILEIGVQYGHSIKLWENYFKNATIYGLDIENKIEHIYPDRVNIIFIDAYSEDALNYFKNLSIKFDIIIDDGPHCFDSQNFFCKNYPNLLNKDGIIIVEDVVIANIDKLIQNSPEFKCINLTGIGISPHNDNALLYWENK